MGSVLRLWALVSIRRWYASDVRVFVGQTVVRSGPYRWLRHPLYLGLCFEALGIAGLSSHWHAWLLALVVVVLSQVQNRRERRILSPMLGDAYYRHVRSTFDIEDFWKFKTARDPEALGTFAERRSSSIAQTTVSLRSADPTEPSVSETSGSAAVSMPPAAAKEGPGAKRPIDDRVLSAGLRELS